jgi:hypothetical protein
VFEHLKKLDATGERKFAMPDLDPSGQLDPVPALWVRPALESNRAYFAARLKSLQQRRKASARRVSQADFEAAREIDRELYPRYVVVGWENVLNAAGEQAFFNRENCEAFLRALPDWLLDELRNYCSEPGNFAGALELTDEETEDLGND